MNDVYKRENLMNFSSTNFKTQGILSILLIIILLAPVLTGCKAAGGKDDSNTITALQIH